MLAGWQAMSVVCSGPEYIKRFPELYLPREPKEPVDAWETRVARSVLTPFTVRLIENAAGMVLRRPIQVTGDPYWEEFSKDVDGIGSSLNEFARRTLVNSLRDGHSAVMVDYPNDPAARTLLEQREGGLRPYFVSVRAPEIYGWRQDGELPYSPLSQVRIHETVLRPRPEDEFQEELIEQMRVIKLNTFELHRHDEPPVVGTYSLSKIPLVPIYTNRHGMLLSSPLLVDIAAINVSHYRVQADRFHAMHLAAMQKLVLEGYEDKDSDLGVNYAINMQPGNKAYWLQADNGSFTAQQELLRDMEMQMSTLGITKLLGQKFVAESADAKRIDQAQANSVMSVISMELERGLNEAFALAAEYADKEPPEIKIDRDFDFSKLLGQDVAVLGQLHENGQLTTDVFLSTLRHGEVLPADVDVDMLAADVDRLKAEKQREAMEQMQQRSESERIGTPNGGRTDQVRRVDRGATPSGVRQ
jgi:hypothetical protein